MCSFILKCIDKIAKYEFIFALVTLKASCNTLVYPNSKLHIRAIITVCDYKNQVRTTRYSYNIRFTDVCTHKYFFDISGFQSASLRR